MLTDRLGRRLDSLRVSVTDRCDLACRYCRPGPAAPPGPRDTVLTFEEIERLVRVCGSLGVTRVRLTGGEPLQRRQLPDLVRRLKAVPDLAEVALTTNGIALAAQAGDLKAAGLDRLTVSLDSLRPERFRAIAGADVLPRVVAGIHAARAAGFGDLNLNAVVLKGLNDDELPLLLGFARGMGATLRLIEFMPIGVPESVWRDLFVPASAILARLGNFLAVRAASLPPGPGPARYLPLGGGGRVGVVAGVSQPFCDTCRRLRLTADGRLRLCLASPLSVDLKGPLREGRSDADLAAIVRRASSDKPRGATYAEARETMCAVGG